MKSRTQELGWNRAAVLATWWCTAAALLLLSSANAFAAAGDMYVAGPGDTVVSRVTPAGKIITFSKDLITPRVVRCDRAGNVYILDVRLGLDPKIYRVTPNGERTELIGKPAEGKWSPQSFVVGEGGYIYLADNYQPTEPPARSAFSGDAGPDSDMPKIRKYTNGGVLLGTLATFEAPIRELTRDRAGNLYATSGSSVFRVTPEGVKTTVATVVGQTLYGLTVDPAGNLFVSTDESAVYKFPAAGGGAVLFASLVQPYHMGSDAAGNIYVSGRSGSSSNGQAFIYRLSPDGGSTVAAGAQRSEGNDGFYGFDIEPPRGKPLNISTRVQVHTGDDALIGGFIITGSAGKKVMLRAIGPSLAKAGITGALQDPTLELYNSSGTFLNGNDDWKDTQPSVIMATGIAPTDERESSLVITLGTGSFTVVVRGKGQTTGVGLVEVYDLDPPADAQLANISTRGRVETGDSVMIGGFIVGANGVRGIVRAIGPSLAEAGIQNPLSNPIVSVRDSNGTEIARNDNWQTTQRAEIEGTGIPPQHLRESAYVGYFRPGSYTAVVSGYGGASGVGLVEFYNLQ